MSETRRTAGAAAGEAPSTGTTTGAAPTTEVATPAGTGAPAGPPPGTGAPTGGPPPGASYPAKLLLLAAAAAFAVVASVAVGAAGISPGEVLAALAGRGDETVRTIVHELRLPRALLALLVGGGLALAGAVFQALLRNPLAEPYILGVSGGAALGAVVALVTAGAAAAPWSVPLAAFLGAVGAVLLVCRIAAGVHSVLDTRVLLLAGVVVGSFFNAIILLLLTVTDAETFRSAMFWMMGSLADARWPTVALLAACMAPALVLLLALARPLNLMAVGEETALFLGTRVERVKLVAYAVTSLIVAASVAVAGAIGFVGLVVPHALRLLWGADHRLLLPASILAGGAFLLAADTVARTVAAPAELPVGVITALVGVPIFVVLLVRSRR